MSHHSSEEMNFAVSFRQAWFGPISKVPFFMVLPILGLDPLMIAVAGVISTLWGVVGHTQIIGKLGPLEWLFNTPSHHRVHHGSNPEYIDKNYGNLLIIWDRLFGTFQPEERPVNYGLVNNVFYKKEDSSIWVDLTDDGLDEKLLLRSDGTSVYMTQDLGTAKQRIDDFPEIGGMVYTVGNEQDYHFQVLFKILKRLGYKWANNLFHLSYGMVDLPTGKMKSREGKVIDADDLVLQLIQY